MVTKSQVVGVMNREFVEKRVFFKKVDEVQGAWKISSDTYYAYVSSVPDEIYDLNEVYMHLRAHTLIGMHRIGKLESGGSYL